MEPIRAKLGQADPPLAPGEWDREKLGAPPNVDAPADETITPSDPSMAAFFELERQLKNK